MTYIDYTIIAILGLFLIKGFFRGFINQVMSIIGLAAGLFIAWKFYPFVSSFGVNIGIHPTVSMVISFILIYTIVAVITRTLGKLIDQVVKKLFLGGLNKIAGAAFGLIEGTLIIAIILILLSLTPLEAKLQKMRQNAPMLDLMQQLAKPFSAKITDAKTINPHKI